MTLTVLLVAVFVGLNTIVWATLGLVRWATLARERRHCEQDPPPLPREVAVLVAAHNEEAGIAATVRSALAQVPAGNVFVVSDASADATVRLAREAGAQVLDQWPNVGKAKALVRGIDHFDLVDRFEAVVFLDADTQLAPDYLETGLLPLGDPETVAVAARATTLADPPPATRTGRVLVAYRERVYVVMQYLQKFGQAHHRVNVVPIVPGFASIYRTRILDRIDIAADGLSIEDFNMTFEVHAKRLGRVHFHPHTAVAYTQDPATVREYSAQVRRWALGFWQTVRRHGVKARPFWAALTLMVLEIVASSVVVLLAVPAIVVSGVASLATLAGVGGAAPAIADVLPFWQLLIGLVAADYLLTFVTALVTGRGEYLRLGFAFPLVRVLDSFLTMRALVMAFTTTSTGVWRSPTRRSFEAPTEPGEAADLPSVPGGSPARDAASAQQRDEVAAAAGAHFAVDRGQA